MFSEAYSFNRDLSNWNVSSVTDMHSMFFKAAKFNQNLCDWDFTSVEFKVEIFVRTSCEFGNNENDDVELDKYACYQCNGRFYHLLLNLF